MDKQRIGFIGLGSMGLPMASRLVQSGYPVAVFNRTRAKSEEVGKLGATVAASPKEAAAGADVVMLSLADHHAVEAMLFGPDGVFGSLRKGGTIVDMSTVPPVFARELARKASEAGYRAMDACILGNNRHAGEGSLRVMVGAETADFQAMEGILATLGKEVTHLGGSGLGATMKLVLNMLMGIEMQALAEAVVFGERAGLPRDKILQMIARSGYSSPVMSFKCGAMERRSFTQVDFKLALMRKDMMLVLEECQDLAVPMPVSESTYSMLTGAKQRGLGDYDCASILAFMEQMSGLAHYPWPPDGAEKPAPSTGPAGGPPPGVRPGGGGRPGGPPAGGGRPGGPPSGGGPGSGGPPGRPRE
jgi:3-hydroxyisobutyrate dehydrogenase